jgi:regulator of sigma D
MCNRKILAAAVQLLATTRIAPAHEIWPRMENRSDEAVLFRQRRPRTDLGRGEGLGLTRHGSTLGKETSERGETRDIINIVPVRSLSGGIDL